MTACLRHLLLALLLVLGQLGAVAHAMSHVAQHQRDGAPAGEAVCKQCLLYGHLGDVAPGGDAAGVPVALVASPTILWAAQVAACDCALPYLSRGPPVLSSLSH